MSVYQGLLEASELGLGASFFRRQVLEEKSPQPPLPQGPSSTRELTVCVSFSYPCIPWFPRSCSCLPGPRESCCTGFMESLERCFSVLAFMLSLVSSHLLSPRVESSHWVLNVKNHLCPRSARSGVFVPRTCAVSSLPVHLVCLTACNWHNPGHLRSPGVGGALLLGCWGRSCVSPGPVILCRDNLDKLPTSRSLAFLVCKAGVLLLVLWGSLQVGTRRECFVACRAWTCC